MAIKKARKASRKRPKSREEVFEERMEQFGEEMKDVHKRVAARRPESRAKRLYRSGKERILGGVCGGIAEYFNIDPVLIRLIWVFASLAWGTGLLLYLICWIVIPRNPRHKW